ncbi:MAG: hypothetical protein WD069_03775 [Planctomycetales bacterium]
MLFHRLHTDGSRTEVALEDSFAGPAPSACWVIGGGPSLATLDCEAIARSPAPKMAVNLAGTRLVRPDFWTSYDPSCRFHRSVYLDAGVMKFLHKRRAMELVPETTFKVCECPSTYFFERDKTRGFADLLAPNAKGIVDWADSLVQAIDILYRLGFRALYLAGCEMRVRPSAEQIARAAEFGVEYDPRELLGEFLKKCRRASLFDKDLEAVAPAAQYHFPEHKPLRSAAHTEEHYFRIANYLRLSRRSLSLAGMQLISATPDSRLNDWFSYRSVEEVVAEIHATTGDPASEPVEGLYRNPHDRTPRLAGAMKDYRPPRGLAAAARSPSAPRFSCEPTSARIELDGELLVEGEGLLCQRESGWLTRVGQ